MNSHCPSKTDVGWWPLSAGHDCMPAYRRVCLRYAGIPQAYPAVCRHTVVASRKWPPANICLRGTMGIHEIWTIFDKIQLELMKSHLPCSNRSENLINRKVSIFYIETVLNFFFQLRKIFFLRSIEKKMCKKVGIVENPLGFWQFSFVSYKGKLSKP